MTLQLTYVTNSLSIGKIQSLMKIDIFLVILNSLLAQLHQIDYFNYCQSFGLIFNFIMLLDTLTLEKIATKNLLKLTLESTQLQTLKSHDSMFAQYQQKFSNIEKSMADMSKLIALNTQQINKVQTTLSGKVKELDHTLSMTNGKVKQFQHKFQQSIKLNPESMKEEVKNEVTLQMWKQIEQKIHKAQDNILKVQEQIGGLDKLSKMVRNHDDKIKDIQEILKKLSQQVQKSKNKKQSVSTDVSNQELKKLAIQLEDVKSELKLVSNNLSQQINTINKTTIPKIKQNQQDNTKQIKKMSDQIWKLNEHLYSIDKDKRQKQQISQNSLDIIFKKLGQLEEKITKIKFQNSSPMRSTLSGRKHEVNTEWNTQTSPEEKRKDYDFDINKQAERQLDQANFKKEIIDKLKQQKGDFAKAIKRLDNISYKKDEEKQRVSNLEERVLKLQHMMEGKVDEENLKKWMRYIQNKIGYLYRMINVQITEEDACIARKNWICLSCDKKLQAYKGKVGHHLINTQLRGKTIQADMVGGGMLFKNKSRYELPQFKK